MLRKENLSWFGFFGVKRFICHVWRIPRIRSNFRLKREWKKLTRKVTGVPRSKIFKRFENYESGNGSISFIKLSPWSLSKKQKRVTHPVVGKRPLNFLSNTYGDPSQVVKQASPEYGWRGSQRVRRAYTSYRNFNDAYTRRRLYLFTRSITWHDLHDRFLRLNSAVNWLK